MTQTVASDIQMVLSLMKNQGEKAALCIGFIAGEEFADSNRYSNVDEEMNRGANYLLSTGIRSFFFTRWSRFEMKMLECLLKFKSDFDYQTILFCDHNCIYIDGDPHEFFDKVFWTDVLELGIEETSEALVTYCGTLAYYDKEGMDSISDAIKQAKAETNIIIDLTNCPL